MTKTYRRKDANTLEVTETVSESHVTEEDRAEIQTKIDHLELEKAAIQGKIDAATAKIAILDA